jgi:subtilisin family serine protease
MRRHWFRLVVLAIGTALLAPLAMTGVKAKPGGPSCFGKPATIVGTSRNDSIQGTDGPDVIVAGAGRDVVRAGHGDDLVCGQSGDDLLDGGSGSDQLDGGVGDDLLDGGADGDLLVGGAGGDWISGGRGDDVARGGAGADRMGGGPGDDVLRGDDGRDYLVGGPGADRALGGSGDDVVVGSRGPDVLLGGPGRDHANGGHGTDVCGAEVEQSCEADPSAGNLPPVLGNDQTSTASATAVLIDVAANDADPDGELSPSTLAVVTPPAHGTATVESGRIRYTPAGGFSGQDTFSYRLCDTRSACATATVTVTVEAAAGVLKEHLTVGGCRPEVTAVKTADQPVATAGSTLTYDLQLRNDPVGACTDPTVTVAGALELQHLGGASTDADSACADDAGTGDACVTAITIWLEHRAGSSGPWTVFPSTDGRTVADDAKGFPEGCPGGTADGCSASRQPTYGNVALPQPTPLAVPADSPREVTFRLFPALAEADTAVLQSCATSGDCGQFRLSVHVSVEQATNTEVVRQPLEFSGGTATAHVVHVADTLPDGSTVDIPADNLAAGAEVTLEGFATYSVPEASLGQLTNQAVVHYQDERGATFQSPPATAATLVEPPGEKPKMVGTTDPAAITAGQSAEVLVTTVPAGTVSSPVEVFRLNGGSRTSLGVLNDDGANGDLVAGDGAWSGTVTLSSSDAAITLQLDAVVDGIAMHSPEFTVEFVPAGIPTTVAPASTSKTVTDPATGAKLLANEALISFDEQTGYADVKAAVTEAGGTLAGYLASIDVWQVRFPAVGSMARLEQALQRLAEQPHVIGTEPNGQVAAAEVKPSDTRYGKQWAPAKVRADETWVVNRGTARPVLVAVIDSGVGPHPDLTGKIAGGWNHVNNNSNFADGNGHGTHVAGIIAANTDNATGIAGICWGCRILAEKSLNNDGIGDTLHSAAAVTHAVNRGAQVLNMSFGSQDRNESLVKALRKAYEANRVVVASAGNRNTSRKNYPGAYHNERFADWFGRNPRDYYVPNLTVAATTPDDRRAEFSNFGDWVDLAAPGTGIMSTVPTSNRLWIDGFELCQFASYCEVDGTSQAAPIVAGAAALLRSENPAWSEAQVRARILQTVKPLSTGLLGLRPIGGRLDIFNASFNAGFEIRSFAGWQTTGTARVVSSLGPIRPTDGSPSMAMLTTGPDSAVTTSTLTRQFRVLPDNEDFELRFSYNYVTEEYPEFVGSQYNDDLTVTLITPGGTRIPLAFESVNTTGWTPISGIDFPGGDATVGQSGWKTTKVNVPIADLQGASTFQLEISDRGDDIYDSAVLLDNIRFR